MRFVLRTIKWRQQLRTAFSAFWLVREILHFFVNFPLATLHTEQSCFSCIYCHFKFVDVVNYDFFWSHHLGYISKFRQYVVCLLYTSPSPRDGLLSRMPSSA